MFALSSLSAGDAVEVLSILNAEASRRERAAERMRTEVARDDMRGEADWIRWIAASLNGGKTIGDQAQADVVAVLTAARWDGLAFKVANA